MFTTRSNLLSVLCDFFIINYQCLCSTDRRTRWDGCSARAIACFAAQALA